MKITDFKRFTSTALPITEMLKVEVLGDDLIRVSATNLRNSISVKIKSKVKYRTEDPFCISPEDLSMIESLGGVASFTPAYNRAEAKTISIQNERQKLALPYELAEDFPVRSTNGALEEVLVLTSTDIQKIKKASLAAATDEFKEALTYVYLSDQIVGVDGQILYVAERGEELREPLLIHKSVIPFLEAGMKVSQTENHIIFEAEGLIITQIKCTEKYPAYKNAIHKFTDSANVDMLAFNEGVNFCTFTANTVTSSIIVKLDKDQCEITGQDPERNKQSKYSLPVSATNPFGFGINAKHIQKMLGSEKGFMKMIWNSEKAFLSGWSKEASDEIVYITHLRFY